MRPAAATPGALVQLVEAGWWLLVYFPWSHARSPTRLSGRGVHQSLLRSTRQQYHQRIAQVLTERFPETAEMQPELLAHHY